MQSVTSFFPANLRLMRRIHGLNQSELASILGKSRKLISSLEGGFRDPTVTIVLALADFFEVSIEDLAFRDFSEDAAGLIEFGGNAQVGKIVDFSVVEEFLEATNYGQQIKDGLVAFEEFAQETDWMDKEITGDPQQLFIVLQEILENNWSLIDKMIQPKKPELTLM